MANQQHLDLLLRGADIWNQWKKEHPRTQPDLSRAFLGEADLSGADLTGAHLQMEDAFSALVFPFGDFRRKKAPV